MAILQPDWEYAGRVSREAMAETGMEGALGTNGGGTVSADEFQALEGKVLQAVEMIRRERDARAAVEAERNAAQAQIAALQERLTSLEEANSTARTELEGYHRERDAVRGRVERMLAQMNELQMDELL